MTTCVLRGDDTSGAIFSRCERYRYVLWRKWDMLDPEPVFMAFIGLNPSTADETVNDPTIRRCIGFAKREGYQGLYMLNLFAFRATLPEEMMAADDPVGGIENDLQIASYVELAGKAIACWGVDGSFQQRDLQVARLTRPSPYAKTLFVGDILWSFGRTKEGHPKHPLYLPADTGLCHYTVKGYR